MTINSVKKECPKCGHSESDIHAAIIGMTDKGEKISFNKYSCIKCHFPFIVQRKGNVEEQALTQKYIDASKIILK